MFEDWESKRKAIKQHILKIYDGTNSQNRAELDRFLEFVINNYDLDDNIFEQVKQDLDSPNDIYCQDILSLENEEYQYNVLDRRHIC